MKLNRTQNNKKRGAALVEYGLLIAGVALVTAAAVSIFGKKTNDLVGTVAAVLPAGGETESTIGALKANQVIATRQGAQGIEIDFEGIEDSTMNSTFGDGANAMIDDNNP